MSILLVLCQYHDVAIYKEVSYMELYAMLLQE